MAFFEPGQNLYPPVGPQLQEAIPKQEEEEIKSVTGKLVGDNVVVKIEDISIQVPEWQSFKRDDLFVLPEDNSLPYRSLKGRKERAFGWGQRKLAIDALSFINYSWDPEINKNPIVVYAGSAPGNNLLFLFRLYPQIEWHLYDPRKMSPKIKTGPKVHIYRTYFTDEIAQQWSGKNVLFMSDIRTVDRIEYTKNYGESSPEMIERGIWNDHLMQQNWILIMKPLAAQLKFRLPWYGYKFSDDIDAEKGIAPYLSGIIFNQPWRSATSSESRLLIKPIDGDYLISNWNYRKYEDQMFYHNNVTRVVPNYFNPFYLDTEIDRYNPIDSPELNNKWDSLAEIAVIIDYLNKHNATGNKERLSVGLSRLLTSIIGVGPTPSLTLDYVRKNPKSKREE